MTIDEAIKILSDTTPLSGTDAMATYEIAIKLGIEALKAVTRARKDGLPLLNYELSGETEE